MRLYPAIDIKDGQCVRLKKGLFNEVTVYSDTPYKIAESFEKDGAKFIHTVDLDGALKGRSVNAETIKKIVNSVNIPVQLGGGIRTLENIQEVLDLGVYRAIIGTKAVENPDFIRQAIDRFGAEHIVVGIDAKDGYVAVEGWEKLSDKTAVNMALAMKEMGYRPLYTQIFQRTACLQDRISNRPKSFLIRPGLTLLLPAAYPVWRILKRFLMPEFMVRLSVRHCMRNVLY